MSVDVTSQSESDGQRFLNPARITRIAELVAPLIENDLSWVERRKESILLLDDVALRRQISVDFSLRSGVEPLLPRELARPTAGSARLGDTGAGTADPRPSLEPLWCAPIFVVEKTAGQWMAFDLEDETGTSLTLISRQDNARISGAVLKAMARRPLAEAGLTLPYDLAADLDTMAEADVADAKQLAHRLRWGSCPRYSPEIGVLRSKERFTWWLHTLSHSSLLVALYRAPRPGRKLIKLRFEQPITEQPKLRNLLGWAPYRVGIENPLIEARSYHLEAEAPAGMRITEAHLTDTESPGEVSKEGFLKRVHLYRPGAQQAGAGTTALFLMVRGGGFIGGAMIASALTLAVITACIVWSSNIAANPTSAPALLLVLPGLIATYVARPDHHALTTKLLLAARLILLLSGGCAYAAAGKLALAGGTPKTQATINARGDSIREWMCLLAVPAALAFLSLGYTFVQARMRFRGVGERGNRFAYNGFVRRTPEQVFHHLMSRVHPSVLSEAFVIDDASEGTSVTFYRGGALGAWFVTFELQPSDGDSLVAVRAEHLPRWPSTLWSTVTVRRAARKIETRMRQLENWTTGAPSPPSSGES